MAPIHYLNQCWNCVNWTLGNKLKCSLNRNLYILIQGNVLEYDARELVTILSRSQCVNPPPYSTTYMHPELGYRFNGLLLLCHQANDASSFHVKMYERRVSYRVKNLLQCNKPNNHFLFLMCLWCLNTTNWYRSVFLIFFKQSDSLFLNKLQ